MDKNELARLLAKNEIQYKELVELENNVMNEIKKVDEDIKKYVTYPNMINYLYGYITKLVLISEIIMCILLAIVQLFNPVTFAISLLVGAVFANFYMLQPKMMEEILKELDINELNNQKKSLKIKVKKIQELRYENHMENELIISMQAAEYKKNNNQTYVVDDVVKVKKLTK